MPELTSEAVPRAEMDGLRGETWGERLRELPSATEDDARKVVVTVRNAKGCTVLNDGACDTPGVEGNGGSKGRRLPAQRRAKG